MKRILCVASTGMGNVLLYLPVIRSLRKQYPEAVIDLLLSNPTAQQLIEGMPEISNIVYFNKRVRSFSSMMLLIRTLRRNHYDIYITSYLDKSIKVALLGMLLRIPVRVGFRSWLNGWLYTIRVPENKQQHEVEYNLDLVRALGITDVVTSNSLQLPASMLLNAAGRLPKSLGRLRIGFHPGSGTDLGIAVKRWDIEKFAELAKLLSDRHDAEIAIFGGPEEQSLAESMSSALLKKPVQFNGETIQSTAALIAQCDLFISNDSGLMHLAAAMRIPVVGIFGPTRWWKNYAWEVPHVIVRSHIHCAPCYRLSGIDCKKRDCLKSIDTNAVFIQTTDFLDKLKRNNVVIPVTAGAHMGGSYIEKDTRVSIITPDFSHDCVGRAYMLAELIKPHAEVEIIGPAFEGFVWEPVARVPHGVSYRYVQCSKKRFFFSAAMRLSKMVKGDVIIISKPVLPSMFLGFFAIMRRRAALIIDIDDGEVGFEIDRFLSGGSTQKLFSFINVIKLMICDRVARCIRHRIVSNTYLKKSFGGLLIPHVRDTDTFDPSLFDSGALRKQFEIDERQKVILFMGTPREHKGLDDLMSAFKILSIPSALLMIVGFDLAEESQRELYSRIKEKIGDRCLLLGQQPFESIPRILSMADVVVIPQQKTHSSVAQIPAKLFDAMAMAKPVIASNVNDIPEILKDCGLVYEADNVEMLAQSLDKILSDNNYAMTLGSRAREKCVAHYSYAAVKEQIKALVNSAIVRNRVELHRYSELSRK